MVDAMAAIEGAAALHRNIALCRSIHQASALSLR
jgi:hypothetical protein